MDLTERERRVLSELEQTLFAEDPTFAEQFSSWRPLRRPRAWGRCIRRVRHSFGRHWFGRHWA